MIDTSSTYHPRTPNDEQYALAQAMTADYGRVLDLIADIEFRNAHADEPWDEMVERLIYEHIGDPLEISATLTDVPLGVLYGWESAKMTDYVHEINVLLGTGGPARGINFRNGDAYCWHQDWGTPRVEDCHPLSNPEILVVHWGMEDY